MAPQPKPPGQRRRRNAGQSQWRELPAEGREGDVPKFPAGHKLSKFQQSYWETIWRSPMAVAFVDADVPALVRLTLLVGGAMSGDDKAAAEARQLEDRFGLSPKSRRALQWEIKQAEKDDGAVDRPVADVRRLRAVDPVAAARG